MNKNLAMHLNQHKVEQKHTFLLKLFSKGKAAVVHHARGCHMRCAGDSCRQTKRPEAAHGLHVSSMFYYLENRSSVLFATEDSTGNHRSCAALIESAASITTAPAKLAVNVGRESCKSTTDSAD